MRISSVAFVIIFGFAALPSSFAHAQAVAPLNPALCDQLFNLPATTVAGNTAGVMTPEVCGAYQFLISRYTVGSCSQLGLTNPQVEGITRLDAKFAVSLANMLKAAPMNIRINSAFRTPQAQQCANPGVSGSNHSKGCAVDLQYNQHSCDTQACQWVRANAAQFGLQMRLQYDPEWNHIEPIQCAGKSLGAAPTTAAPFDNILRGLLGQNQNTQMNTAACVTSVSPLVVAQPGTVPQSQCIWQAQQPPQLPAQPSGSTQPSASASPATSASAPTTQPSTQTTPPLGSQNTTPSAPGSCSPQFYCSGTTYFYRDSTCVDRAYQSCPYGCAASGSTCALAPQSGTSSAQSILSNLFATSSTAGVFGTSATIGSSTLDLINAYANLSPDTGTAADVGTSTPIALNQDTQRSIEQIQAAASSSQTINVIMQPQQQPTVQQTFTSSDFGNGAPLSAPPQNTALSQILGIFKQILTYALNYLSYLKPFGGNVGTQTYE